MGRALQRLPTVFIVSFLATQAYTAMEIPSARRARAAGVRAARTSIETLMKYISEILSSVQKKKISGRITVLL